MTEARIPEGWVMGYAAECLAYSKTYDAGSDGEQLALRRAQHALDLLTVWRATPHLPANRERKIMRQFIIRAPDGRLLEPRGAEGLEAIKAGLLPGFEIAFEVLDGTFQVEPLPDGLPAYTILSYLLERHGDELRAWLKKK